MANDGLKVLHRMETLRLRRAPFRMIVVGKLHLRRKLEFSIAFKNRPDPLAGDPAICCGPSRIAHDAPAKLAAFAQRR